MSIHDSDSGDSSEADLRDANFKNSAFKKPTTRSSCSGSALSRDFFSKEETSDVTEVEFAQTLDSPELQLSGKPLEESGDPARGEGSHSGRPTRPRRGRTQFHSTLTSDAFAVGWEALPEVADVAGDSGSFPDETADPSSCESEAPAPDAASNPDHTPPHPRPSLDAPPENTASRPGEPLFIDPTQRRLTLAELREKMGEISKLAPPEGWHLPGLKGEVKRGSLVELLGNDRQEWLIDLYLAYPEARLAWVAPRLTIFPTALAQRGVKLSRCLFLETQKELSWSLMQVLRSGLFSFVMAPVEMIPPRQADATLRKLQIMAERSQTTLFFLSDQATSSFSFTYRIEVNHRLTSAQLIGADPAEKFLREIKVLKQKRSALCSPNPNPNPNPNPCRANEPSE